MTMASGPTTLEQRLQAENTRLAAENERMTKDLGELCGDYEAQLAALKAELEIERCRLAACGVAALGYFEGCNDEYKSASLDDVLRLYSKLEAMRSASSEPVAKAIHYPECWDTAAYPTMESALAEVTAYFKCTVEDCRKPTHTAQSDKDAALVFLQNLVEALDEAFISSWQSTHAWQKQLDAARDYIDAAMGEEK